MSCRCVTYTSCLQGGLVPSVLTLGSADEKHRLTNETLLKELLENDQVIMRIAGRYCDRTIVVLRRRGLRATRGSYVSCDRFTKFLHPKQLLTWFMLSAVYTCPRGKASVANHRLA